MNYDVLAEEIEDVTLSNADIGSLKVPTLNSVSKEVENKPDVNEVISITKLESTNILNAGMKNSYVVVRKNEILVMDSPEIDNAVNVWRWNKNGLMHSNSGYNGIYTMGLRYDGIIFADLIKAGILKSLNGESWINLDSGEAQLTGNIITKSGDKYVSMNSGGITFQDNHKSEQLLRVASSYLNNRDLNGVIFASAKYADYIRFSNIPLEDLTQGWTSEVDEYTFFDLCSNDFTINTALYYKGMNIRCPMHIRNTINIRSNDESAPHQIYSNTNSFLTMIGDNGIVLDYRQGLNNKVRLKLAEAEDSSGCVNNSYGNWNFNGYTVKNANLVNTYANLETKSIAEVSALETNSTDNIRYIYKDITSKDNKIVLNIPNEYQGRDYDIVGVAKFGFGDYAITSKEENRFIIETDREMTMNIEISIN